MIRITARVAFLALAFIPCLSLAQQDPLGHIARSLHDKLVAADFLYDEEELEASVKEVASLREREAEALARALADCAYSHMPGDVSANPCSRARAYFVVIGPDGTSLSRLFATLHYYSLTWLSRPRDGLRPTEDRQHVARMQLIEMAWTTAVRLRLQALDREAR